MNQYKWLKLLEMYIMCVFFSVRGFLMATLKVYYVVRNLELPLR